MEKKHFFSIFLGIFLWILSIFLLTGCGAEEGDPSSSTPSEASGQESTGTRERPGPDPGEETGSQSLVPFSHTLPEKVPEGTGYDFPETAPFIDDTGRAMQRDGDCFYSYYMGKLLRFDTRTEQMTLLYETASVHLLDFCLYKDDIYFVERTSYDSLDGRDTSLWRIGKDGKDLTLLQDDIPNAARMSEWGDNYGIDIYDDILYLLNTVGEYQNGEYVQKTANLYYRIQADGAINEVGESETLYGALPGRFSPVFDEDFPTFPFAMRNYGYLFIQDAGKAVYRMDPKSHTRESLGFDTGDAGRFFFSGDQILFVSYYYDHDDAKDSILLFHLTDSTYTTVDDYPDSYLSSMTASAADEGFFLCFRLFEKNSSSDETSRQFHLVEILSDGSTKNLVSSSQSAFDEYFSEENYDYYGGAFTGNSCILGDHLYFYNGDGMNRHLLRFSLGENAASEELAVFPRFPTASPSVISVQENYEDTDTDIGGGSLVSFSCSKAFIEEETEADRLINQALDDIYADYEEYVEEIITEEKEELQADPDLYEGFDYVSGHDFSLSASCDYMDDDTISFCIDYYQFFAYAAHGYYWNDYYVFDRETGELLTCEDFVKNSAVFLHTARPYVEQAAGWDFDDEMLLEPTRFSLSEDGYTLYFAPYDIDCYAAGSFLITIPYEAFEREL